MKTINLTQGSEEWLAFRREHFNASDTAAMLGISPYKTRNQLLQEYATGVTKEFDAHAQARLDKGHELETAERCKAEVILGEELYPAVGEYEAWPKLSASFDGITMDESIVWEHKTLNESIREAGGTDEQVPEYIAVQVQQQLLISGANKVMFAATNESGEKYYCTIYPNKAMQERVVAGWKQFEKDLAAWKPEESAPIVEGAAPDSLPSLLIQVTGAVTASNLPEFRARALQVIGEVNTDLATDQDFADAEKAVKWCKDVESRLTSAKEMALAQTVSIDELFRTIDQVSEEARKKRLTLEKLVKSRKEEIRISRTYAAVDAFREHLKGLNDEIHQEWTGKVGRSLFIQVVQPEFGAAIKGLKTISSVDNALATVLANAKIEADARAREMREKLRWFSGFVGEYLNVFPDLQSLIQKPHEDFQNSVKQRIVEAEAAEERKLEVERERIRQEEAAKLEAARKAEEAQEKVVESVIATAPELVQLPPVEPEAMQEQPHPLPMMDTAMIRSFLRVRDFGKEESHIRSVLVEFVKFCIAQQSMPVAA